MAGKRQDWAKAKRLRPSAETAAQRRLEFAADRVLRQADQKSAGNPSNLLPIGGMRLPCISLITGERVIPVPVLSAAEGRKRAKLMKKVAKARAKKAERGQQKAGFRQRDRQIRRQRKRLGKT